MNDVLESEGKLKVSAMKSEQFANDLNEEFYKRVIKDYYIMGDSISEISAECIEGLKYAIEMLPEPEKTVVLTRYKSRSTFRDVGKAVNLSTVEAKKAFYSGRDKLFSLPLRLYLLHGFSYGNEHQDILGDIKDAGIKNDRELQIRLAENVYITEVFTSSRMYWPFRLEGLNTLADVMQIVEKDPAKITTFRKFGPKTIKEFILILESLSIDCSVLRNVIKLSPDITPERKETSEKLIKEIYELSKDDMNIFYDKITDIPISDIFLEENILKSCKKNKVDTLGKLFDDIKEISKPMEMIDKYGVISFQQIISFMARIGFSYVEEFRFVKTDE